MTNSFDFLAQKKAGQKLTAHAKNTLLRAQYVAQKQNSLKVENIHVFYSVFLEKGSLGSTILKDMGIKKENFKKILAPNKKNSKKSGRREKFFLSPETKNVLVKAFSIAKNLNYSYVGTEHLTYALLNNPDGKIKKIISSVPKITRKNRQNFKKPSIKKIPSEDIIFSDPKELLSGLKDMLSGFPDMPMFPEISTGVKNINSPDLEKTPYLNKFCLNLNEEISSKNESIIGRDKEVARIINILGRKNKNNPLLIGQPGVGKTAIVGKLAQLINNDLVPPFLFGKKIMNLDVAALIAGTSFRGEFEMRLKEIIKEVSQNKDIILFIDEIHNIVGAGNIAGSLDLANIIKPALSRGEVRLIGATTLKEYKQHIEKDAALDRRFQLVHIKEPGKEETKKILLGIKNDYEVFHNISITDEAVGLAVDLSCRYIQERFLPDKAIDIIDEAASQLRSKQGISDMNRKIRLLERQKQEIMKEKELHITKEKYENAIGLKDLEKEMEAKITFLKNNQEKQEKEKSVIIQKEDIMETVAKISGIPMEKIARAKNQKIKKISKVLNEKIIGQKEAVEKISSVLTRSQFGISSPDRPLGSFLFLGPTGVGKTLTAKVLAKEFFENEKNLVRIDMSEFMERHNVSGLIGSPAGYVGYGEGGRLTEKIRRQPYSVVLFDEIEKAHSDIFNILLQILEEGILTDAQGLEVNFKNTIIILTTNIGTREFNEISSSPLGFSDKKTSSKGKTIALTKESALKELEEKIRPELLNRLDHILVFSPLSPSAMEKIARTETENLRRRLQKQNLTLEIRKGVFKIIAKKASAKNQGARLIRKNIQEMIEDKIAKMIMKDEVKKNKIVIAAKDNKIILK
ncbi:MAG TPA: ATP-dependent Clp protease ATP-binding subunit [Candidatus Moranbacteria bacterium]|nr:ATP-dependent Clp protease ATP-binding subunit [Candidatus Moranbacteria bacterium]